MLNQLGPYRLGKLLGRGGMGSVYYAVEEPNGQLAAVKILSGAMGREEGFRERFRAEIESLRKLHHPNIVRIFGYGEEQDCQFYAMELVEGRSLDEAIKLGRRFEWTEAVAIVLQVCKALRHAHDRGVIHRDIKPANLLMADDGTVKLSDFGIAKLFGSSGVTSDGGVLGTAEYMAPEQADGRAAGPRSDLYSLGGVFYAILAHRPPLKGKDIVDTLHMQRYTVPDPIRKYCPDVPEELEEIIAQLLAKAPEDRFPNAKVLEKKLEGLLAAPTMVDPAEEDPADDAAERLQSAESNVLSAESVRLDAKTPASGELRAPSGATLVRPIAPLSPGSLAGDSLSFQLEGGELLPSPEAKPAAAPPPPPAATFVPVRPDEHRRFEPVEDETPAWISPQTWGLALGLISIGLLLLWYLQPPSADRLFDSIEVLAAENRPERLAEAEPSIAAFLRHYSDDPRAAQLRAYQDEIDLYRLEKQFELRARRATNRDALGPIERAYLEAVHLMATDPSEALKRFRALRDMHQATDETSATTRQCMQLADRQRERLEKQLARQAVDDCKMIDARLTQADELAAKEPEEARRIYEATVVLYEAKPWAAEQVKRARAGMEKLRGE